MKSRKRVWLCLLALMMCMPALASAKVVIDSVSANLVGNYVTILGSGFGTGTPVVDLDGQALTLLKHDSTQIQATLPSGIGAGSYLVTVTASGSTGSFDVTIGATGPQGPQGPQGPAGLGLGYAFYFNGATALSQGNQLIGAASEITTTGVYYISGAATVYSPDSDVIGCWINSVFLGDVSSVGEAGPLNGIATISLTGSVLLNAGDFLQLYCVSGYNNGQSIVYNSGFTAILINVSNNGSIPEGATKHNRHLLKPGVR